MPFYIYIILFRGRELHITAIVTEDITRNTITGEEFIQFERYSIDFEFLTQTPDVFRSGYDWTAYVSMSIIF